MPNGKRAISVCRSRDPGLDIFFFLDATPDQDRRKLLNLGKRRFILLGLFFNVHHPSAG